MSCQLPVKRFVNNAIMIGFPWKTSMSFGTGTKADFTGLDLSLYDIYFAIAPSETSTLSVVPTITTYANGLATFEFTDVQTAAMTAGEWVGHCFIQLKVNGSPEYQMKLAPCVIDPVPTP